LAHEGEDSVRRPGHGGIGRENKSFIKNAGIAKKVKRTASFSLKKERFGAVGEKSSKTLRKVAQP